MRIKALFLPLLLVTCLSGQDKDYVALPGAPTMMRPVWAEPVGKDAICKVGDSNITLENLEFEKPFFGGDWKITFDISNHIGRDLEDVDFQFWFFSKSGEVLTNPFQVVHYVFPRLDQSTLHRHFKLTVAKPLWPERHKDVANLKVALVSFMAPKTFEEKLAERRLEREAEMKAQQAKRDAERAREEAESAEMKAKLDKLLKDREEKEKRAAAASRKKREAAIARQPPEIQALIRKRQIRIGMNREQVVLAWGRPSDINTTTFSRGTHEQWVYSMKSYVYFEDGVVTTIQN